MNSSTSGEIAPGVYPEQALPEVNAPEAEAPLPGFISETGTEDPARDQYWRREVADRLERYRSRRKPRGPRYPSLRLPFEPAETSFSSQIAAAYAMKTSSAPAPQIEPVREHNETDLNFYQTPRQAAAPAAEARTVPAAAEHEFSNLIEFPRSAVVPVFRGSELAEPVLDRPRIVEAPEVIPPPPALGGILIETIPVRESEKVPELALRPASLLHRVLAGAMDFLFVLAALAGFTGIFYQVNPGRPPLPILAAGLLAVTLAFWSVYEFFLVVYTGTTPGWRIARLRLAKFDGSPVPCRLRRWRVLASILSAFSLGLGYLWSMLDEDGLCWHDRITRTCLQPVLSKRATQQLETPSPPS